MRKKLIALTSLLALLTALTPFADVNFTTVYAANDCLVMENGMLLEYSSDELSIALPDTVTSIGKRAFWQCISLTVLTIPDTVTFIDKGAFEECNKLQEVYYAGSADDWNNIWIDVNNYPLVNADIHYNCDFIPLAIAAQPPRHITALKGETATFTVKATGEGLRYQWQLSDDYGASWRSSKVTADTYSATVSENNDCRLVRCVVTDKYGASVTSEATAMKMAAQKLQIIKQPDDGVAELGDQVQITVEAVGDDLNYSWICQPTVYEPIVHAGYDEYFFSNIYCDNEAPNTNTYTVTLTEQTNNMRVICCIYDKHGDSVCSRWVTVKTPDPQIISQPVSVQAAIGSQVTFSVEAVGTDLTYQWFRCADNEYDSDRCIDGAESASYTTTLTKENQGNRFYCIVEDKYHHEAFSDNVIMEVAAPGVAAAEISDIFPPESDTAPEEAAPEAVPEITPETASLPAATNEAVHEEAAHELSSQFATKTADLPAVTTEATSFEAAAKNGALSEMWQVNAESRQALEEQAPIVIAPNVVTAPDAPTAVAEQADTSEIGTEHYLPSVLSNALCMNLGLVGIAVSLAAAVVRKRRRRFLAGGLIPQAV